jgi:3-methylcrotonyl-CoA carboxylase beta subunit
MGGEQAASVLATVKREQLKVKGSEWPADEEESFKQPIREQYERQGHPYYSSARLWDDGVIDPRDTRRVLSLALAVVSNAPQEPQPPFGVFRM